MKELLAKIIANWAGRLAIIVLVFGLPGIFTYIIPCRPCYDATMVVGGMIDGALNEAARKTTTVTGVTTPAEVSGTVAVGVE